MLTVVANPPDRLVESTKIKKAIHGLYTAFLAKGASPFVYLSLHIDPAKVDVNVHPTKSEVHFLHEDEIVDAVVAAVDKALAGANASRSFTVQTMLPGAEAFASQRDRGDGLSTQRPKSTAPNYKVRMDPTNRTLDSMVAVLNPSQISPYDERASKRRGVSGGDEVQLVGDDDDDEDDTPMWNATAEDKTKETPESACDFESIQDLRRAVRKRASLGELGRACLLANAKT